MTESSEQRVEYLTAETEQGRAAIREVMDRSYQADIERIPPGWARVRLVDGVPVSFILIDPDRRIDLMAGEMRYAFIADAATRTDRRGEGHFRATLDEAFARLRDADIPLVITHGRVDLYRRFGFDVFTHHCGIFARASRIEAHLGLKHPPQARERLRTMDAPYVHPNLLVVEEATGIGASSGVESLPAARTVLQAAAAIARERGRERILFEHPAAPSYGSRYPIYSSLETPLTSLARTCGALICVQGAGARGRRCPMPTGSRCWMRACLWSRLCAMSPSGTMRYPKPPFASKATPAPSPSSGPQQGRGPRRHGPGDDLHQLAFNGSGSTGTGLSFGGYAGRHPQHAAGRG